MSFPDYQQCAEDHQCLLIVVKQIGPQISQKLFNRIYEGISKLCEICISDAQGMGFERTIRVRYKRFYSIENNDWGDFQAHRKVLGLITVGKSFNDNEIESIYELHNTIRETFANTLYDSRCFIVNNSNDTNTLPQNQSNNHSNNDIINSSSILTTQLTNSDNNIDKNSYFDEIDSFNEVRDISKAFTSAGDDILAGDDIIDGYDINERLPSCTQEPILSDDQLLITHVNMDSSESSPESPDETNAHKNGLIASSLESASSNTSPTKSLQNLTLDNNNVLSNTLSPNTNSIINSIPSLSTKSQFTQFIRYENDQECCDQIESNVKDFISSLFWVLESKRLDRTHEKQDKVPLLIAPFEKKDLIGLDTDTRTFRKRCLGRMRKHIADLSLLAGLPSEALTHYTSAIDQLRAVSDWLWMASAIEGQCVASLALLYPNSSRRRRLSGFQRNLSLPLTPNKASNVKNRKLVNINNTNASNSKSLPNGLDPIFSKAFGKSILTPNDIYEKYKEAACQYAKYRNAAILEFECSFKAARVLTELEKYLYASEFIQNAVFITFNQTNEEQIERLSMIADLYSNIGYLRKAAFYKRFAALKAVSLHLQNPNWEKCYYLLLPSLEGYGLTLDPMEYQRRIASNSIGWPGIHMQLLQELVTTSIKMNNEPLAVRHLSFLLHSLFDHLSTNQRQEFATKLFTLSSRCGEGSPVPLKLSNGAVIPSVNLTKFPTVISFKVQNLSPHLRPIKLKSKLKANLPVNTSTPSSPFIFTPLQFNRSNVNASRKFTSAATLLDFKWSEGEICKIAVILHNYLPIELNIIHMGIMTDGLAFETYPTSLSLGAESVSSTINLTGIPRASGKLDILGYTTHALGVKSDCRLKELPNAKKMKLPNSYTIEVIPHLPLIDISCSLPKANQFSTILANDGNHIAYSASLSLFAGEKRTCKITLSNNSPNNQLIEIINVVVISKLPKHSEKQLFEWNEDSINNELPLACGSTITFDLTVNAIGGFVVESNTKKSNTSTNRSTTTSATQSPYGSHHNSPMHTGGTSATKKSQLLGSTTLANFISELQTSNKQKQSDKQVISNNLEPYPSKVIEALLQFEYSGGPGLASGYCRQSSLAITVEIQPSLLITHWDVLPADQPTNCFLVLDALNATNEEMELYYAVNKEILIEARETCRIPVPIERCPLVDDINCDDREDSSLLSRCRAHLVNQVNLNWMLSASGIRGDASIVNVPYSDEMLNSILLSPIQWEVSLNELNLRTGNEFTFKSGEFISLSISLYNCSGISLKSLNLVIHCYQDYQNSHKIGKERNYRLEMKRALTGFDRVFIPEIQSKQSYLHECGFTFFYSGIYKLDIQCDTCNEPSIMYKKQANTEFIESKPFVPSTSLWKCSPNIEINIE